jgi:hypothetical protein
VNPTRSANRTDTVRRSSALTVNDAPQAMQNLASAGFIVPQLGHATIGRV